jgi:hypothetical protein
MDGSCEYIEYAVAGSRQGVALQLGDWAWGQQLLAAKNKLVKKDHKKPRTWTEYLDNRPKLRKMDMRFCTWNVRSMSKIGSLITVEKEISKSKLDLVGVQDVR